MYIYRPYLIKVKRVYDVVVASFLYFILQFLAKQSNHNKTRVFCIYVDRFFTDNVILTNIQEGNYNNKL